MTIEKEILDLVQKSLPEVQAKATAELMNEYKNLKDSRPALIEQVKSLTEQLSELLKIIESITNELESYKQRESKIYEGEKELEIKEKEFMKKIYDERLKCYEMADNKIEKFFDRVFSNPVYKENIITNRVAHTYYDNQGGTRPSGGYDENYNKETFIK